MFRARLSFSARWSPIKLYIFQSPVGINRVVSHTPLESNACAYFSVFSFSSTWRCSETSYSISDSCSPFFSVVHTTRRSNLIYAFLAFVRASQRLQRRRIHYIRRFCCYYKLQSSVTTRKRLTNGDENSGDEIWARYPHLSFVFLLIFKYSNHLVWSRLTRRAPL